MLERYLAQLGQEAGKTLPPHEVDALVADAREHLNDSIQARLELGRATEEAEREAVEAFGEARRIAQEVARESARPREKARSWLLALAYALFIVGLVVGPPFQRWSETAYHAIFVLGWLAVAIFAVASFRARRPAPVRIVATGLVATVVLWLAVGTTWLNLYRYGGKGEVPRIDVRRMAAEESRVLAQGAKDRATFEVGREALRVKGIEALRVQGGYRAPLAESMGYGRPLRYAVFRDAREAKAAWLQLIHRSDDAFYTEWTATTLRAIPAAQADPLGNLVAFAPESLTIGAAAAAAGGAVDLAFGGLGALAFALRRRRDGGGLRA